MSNRNLNKLSLILFKNKHNFKIGPKSLFLIFMAVAILILSSALTELYQSKRELFDLMKAQSHSLLESIQVSSRNALLASEKVEQEIKNRLLNNANIIKILFERKEISNKVLERIAEENGIYRINIFNNKGKKLFSSHKRIHFDRKEKFSPVEKLKPIFEDETDTLIVGIKEARYEDGYRFVVAVATKNNGAIVLNVNADKLLDFRKQIGFGVLMKNLTKNPGIVYLILQDSNNVLAAAGKLPEVDSFYNPSFLNLSVSDSGFTWHIARYDTLEVFESSHVFKYKNRVVGIFRTGISLEPLYKINSRIKRRIVIIGLILFVMGSFILSLIFFRQNYDLLEKQYQTIETYSNKILNSIHDAIIVTDENYKIKTVNPAAISLFQASGNEMEGKTLDMFFDKKVCSDFFSTESQIFQLDCKINGKLKHMLISKTGFKDEEGKSNTIFILRDLTELKKLEQQIQRKERLIAMGELASGIAHEIRNPLNTIGTIAQQLHKDFQPEENKDEYNTLSGLVYNEVKRINNTIQNFLKFARPEEINSTEFDLTEFLKQIKRQYLPLLNEKNIELIINENWHGEVIWDKDKIKQSLINLIQNSIDAIKDGGKIEIKTGKTNGDIIIKVSDTGEGIEKEKLKKIFNLYFTTKAGGTGIGLSIVQKIIYEHGGLISVESKKGEGTVFTIKLPQEYSRQK